MKIENLEQVGAYSYEAKGLDGHSIKSLLKNPHLFREGIATYVGKEEYPKFLRGIKEILHINNTTVCLAYNPSNLDTESFIFIHGTGENASDTKSLLEHILKISLVEG